MGLLIICSRYKIAKTDITFSKPEIFDFRAFSCVLRHFRIFLDKCIGNCRNVP